MLFKSFDHFHLVTTTGLNDVLRKPSSIKKLLQMPVFANASVDIHLYAKHDQNIPCGSRVMSIFTN